jgi:murein DD-endopeptidase MepM/ murein hydrolase activator NlpD
MHVRPLDRIAVLALLFSLLACHPRGGIIHRVESGESLTLISHVYEVPIKDLLEANPRVTSDDLRPGESILVPGASETRRTPRVVWELDDVRNVTQEEPEEAEEVRPKPPEPAVAPKVAMTIPTKSRSVKVAPKKLLEISWPATGAVISRFGMRNRKMHNGIDIRVAPEGDILATAEGKVVYVGTDVEGYGRLLILRHPTNLFSVYAYLGRILVEKGTNVERGTILAKANSKASEAFFHFELRRGKRALDPLAVLPK